ncbi:unnamed protein product [Phyllotreta striolata]|uniref:Pacifastin domain-containing protein n=1 Tax=Phyllotreta striolata TaxID=444603 RepID=A0A9N9TPK4_PHYSR|nr:unnamed protein product [Phyllotreta striolata]
MPLPQKLNKLSISVERTSKMKTLAQRAIITVVFALCASVCLTDATMCRPNSKFHIDCNTCECSSNGAEYSCTRLKCQPADYQSKYDVTYTKEGYKLLVPKNNDEFNFDDDDELLIHSRKPRVPPGYPYINDELPAPEPSLENDDNNVDSSDDKFIDIDGDEDDVENIDEDNLGNTVDDEDAIQTNEINHDRWDRFIPNKVPDFPE